MRNLVFAIAFGSIAATSAYAQASFQTVDADADGSVTYAEAVNAGMPWSEEQFKLADQNADGGLDEAEFTAAIQ